MAGVAVAALCVGGVEAADLVAPEPFVGETAPTPIDVAFGVAGATDYRFRGVSNSSRDPAIQGYVEVQAFDWVYAGVWASSVRFPAPWRRTDPSAEIDIYGGLRHSWGGFTLDVGGLYYYYPGMKTLILGDGLEKIDYWELYAKPTVALGDFGAVSGNLYWSSDFLNLGSDAVYLSVIPKINIPVAALPGLGFYVSAELGKQWLGRTSKLVIDNNWIDYLTWNIGGGVTYQAMTLDIRYSDTNLSRNDCAFNYNSRTLCGSAVVAKLSFDTALSMVK